MTQGEKAAALRALHQPGHPLLLANVWDAVSARMLEQARWPAVATSSAAIANAYGYPDGERIPRGEMLEAVARICRAVAVPVSADLESGYGATPEEWSATTAALLAAGAVGCNLEDSGSGAENAPFAPLELQCARLRAVRATAAAAGVPLVINARCDAFFLHPAPPAGWDAMAEAVHRAAAYRAAGADCIFVPGLTDPAAIRRLLEATPGPLNILGGPGAPPVAEFAAAGVARISLGSGPHRAALGWFARVAEELRGPGTYTTVAEVAPSYADVNALLEPRAHERS